METRRGFLKAAVATFMLPETIISGAEGSPAGTLSPSSVDEEDFVRWYDVDRSIVNLENAYWNVMSRPVMEEYWNSNAICEPRQCSVCPWRSALAGSACRVVEGTGRSSRLNRC